MAINAISISELDENIGGSLWVLNDAQNMKRKNGQKGTIRGKIFIGIPDVAGKTTDGLVIPQTWLPIDVNTMVPRQQLLQSRQFRRALNDGLIKIISEEDAQRILSTVGAEEEQERLDRENDIVLEATKQRKITAEMTLVGGNRDDDDPDEGVEMFGEESLAEATKRGIEADEDGVQPSFKMLADRWADEGDMSVLNAMRARGKFTPAELRYMKAVLNKDVHVTTLQRIEAGLKSKK
jgi:hypothetical protein